MGYSRKNPNRGVEDILFWKTSGIFHFFTLYPWKFQTKQSLTPGYSNEILFVICIGLRLGIQDSKFKIQEEKYENAFQNKYQILENESVCPQ